MKQTRGYLLRDGISIAAMKVCSALRLDPVIIRWKDVGTAMIDSRGRITLPDVRDDAVIPHKLIIKYTAFVVHELLHRKYTNFKVEPPNTYVQMLTNGLEDARIENKAIADGLTGNIGNLLGDMIDMMTLEALDEVDDWNDPAQFPFVLAVHARNHATIKLPMQKRIRVLFDEAKERLNTAANTKDVQDIAIWLFEKLKSLDAEQPPEPSEGNDSGGESGEGESDGNESGDGESGSGGAPSDLPDEPVKPQPSVAVNPEPELKAEKGVKGGVSWSPDQTIGKDRLHVGEDIQWKVEL